MISNCQVTWLNQHSWWRQLMEGNDRCSKKDKRLDPLDFHDKCFHPLYAGVERGLLSPLLLLIHYGHLSFEATHHFSWCCLFFSIFLSSKLSWGCITAVSVWWMKSSPSSHAHKKPCDWENQVKELECVYLHCNNLVTQKPVFTWSWAAIRILSYPVSYFWFRYFKDITWQRSLSTVCVCVSIYKQPTIQLWKLTYFGLFISVSILVRFWIELFWAQLGVSDFFFRSALLLLQWNFLMHESTLKKLNTPVETGPNMHMSKKATLVLECTVANIKPSVQGPQWWLRKASVKIFLNLSFIQCNPCMLMLIL